MNITIKFFLMAILVTQTAFAINHRNKNYHEKAKTNEILIFRTSHKTYTSIDIKNDPILHFADNYDSGFPKTYVSLENLPENKKLKFDCKRPILNNGFDNTSNTNDLINNSLYHAMPCPFFIISGRGFLPGESVEVIFTVLPTNQSSSFVLTPNPIPNIYFDENAYISIRMVSMNPTMYIFKLHGFDESESLKFHSNSEGEELVFYLKVKESKESGYAPEVVKNDRGISLITVTRTSTGVYREFKLPWGMNLIPYLKGEKNGI